MFIDDLINIENSLSRTNGKSYTKEIQLNEVNILILLDLSITNGTVALINDDE